jgi:anti-sigma regulatory factor (Ser/Thr protein kinase)
MTRVRVRGEEVRSFILQNVEAHPAEISKVSANHFNVSRQAINKHLQRLCHEGSLKESGKTRNRSYVLAPLVEWSQLFLISPGLEEDVVWAREVGQALGEQPENVRDIWQYGFTEMFNNARDHSGGTSIYVAIKKTATATEMMILDDGVGIFQKIQQELNLLDVRHAVFELTKGKLTTDPERHTGEGIFFTSRMFDSFDILSAGVYFKHEFGEAEDWIIDNMKPGKTGTAVWLKLNNHTARTTKKIFDQFSGGDDFGFNKTVVPVSLAQYGNDKLISRSQAKRVVARFELFKTVILDFADVQMIGQAFADEIFRVFANQHPNVVIYVTNTNPDVHRMIERAKAGAAIEDPVPITRE